MVAEEEIDNVIALWPPNWKIGFKTGMKGTEGTITVKVIPPVIIKDTRGPSKSIGKDMGTATQKDVQQKHTTEKDAEVETQLDLPPDLGTKGLDAGGTASPRATKQTSKPIKGP